MYVRLSEAEKNEIWTQLGAGESFRMIARKLGRSSATVRDYMASTGGVRPAVRTRRGSYLAASEREEITRGLAAGQSFGEIARRMRRSPSTVCKEVNRNGGRRAYRSLRARWDIGKAAQNMCPDLRRPPPHRAGV